VTAMGQTRAKGPAKSILVGRNAGPGRQDNATPGSFRQGVTAQPVQTKTRGTGQARNGQDHRGLKRLCHGAAMGTLAPDQKKATSASHTDTEIAEASRSPACEYPELALLGTLEVAFDGRSKGHLNRHGRWQKPRIIFLQYRPLNQAAVQRAQHRTKNNTTSARQIKQTAIQRPSGGGHGCIDRGKGNGRSESTDAMCVSTFRGQSPAG